MKHLKYFPIFENKTHDLSLPKTQYELDELKRLPGFRNLENLRGYRRTGCDLVIMRNGGVEIVSPVNYNFKVSPTGNFYYGGLKVGPKYTTIDTWDKLFDYAYLYFLGTGRNIATSTTLEKFVFYGEVSNHTFDRIKNEDEFLNILELVKKYSGGVVDKIIIDNFYKSKDIEQFISIISSDKFNYIVKDTANQNKIIEILKLIRAKDPVKYSKAMDKLKDIPFINDAISDLYNQDRSIIKGGSIIRRLGLDLEEGY